MATLTITGTKSLARRFAATPGILRKLTNKVAEQAANGVAIRARSNVAVDTGNLRSAIKAVRLSPSAWIVTIAGGRPGDPRDPGTYAHFVEYGTVHMAAQPFMRPAAEQQASAMGLRMTVAARALPSLVKAA